MESDIVASVKFYFVDFKNCIPGDLNILRLIQLREMVCIMLLI